MDVLESEERAKEVRGLQAFSGPGGQDSRRLSGGQAQGQTSPRGPGTGAFRMLSGGFQGLSGAFRRPCFLEARARLSGDRGPGARARASRPDFAYIK